eukprot:scaffold1001_cov334-Prasinococcus_capsulatus_cf.AAC.3
MAAQITRMPDGIDEREDATERRVAGSGFEFGLCRRNAALMGAGVQLPKKKKTGTTIAGVIFKDGVVLGADTRATEGETVCDKVRATDPLPPPWVWLEAQRRRPREKEGAERASCSKGRAPAE